MRPNPADFTAFVALCGETPQQGVAELLTKSGPPRTRKSSLTLAAVKPWGDWVSYRHTGDQGTSVRDVPKPMSFRVSAV
jgi:hypothetical protein